MKTVTRWVIFLLAVGALTRVVTDKNKAGIKVIDGFFLTLGNLFKGTINN